MFRQAFYLQTNYFTHLIKPTLPSQTHLPTTLPSNTFTYLQTPLQNLTTFTIPNLTLSYTLWTLFWTATFQFVVYSIWCKTLFIVVVYKFCCMYKSFVPFFKRCLQFSTAVEVRFIISQNVGLNRAFWGLIKSCGVMIIVAGYGHGDTSSNPGRDWLHFT